MPIIRRHPWGFEDFFGDEEFELPERFFEGQRPRRRLRRPEFPAVRAPRMDVYETEKEVTAEIELPGVDPKNVEVTVRDNMLKVEAKAEQKKEEKKRGYFRRELSRGYYKRVVPLPAKVQGEKAKAVYESGILKVSIPKEKPAKKEKGKKVEIKVKTA